MSFRVVFTPESQEQLVALYHYVAKAASPRIAGNYTTAIVDYCESLTTFPRRGTLRDDVRPGLRVTNYRKRTLIAYTVESDQVSIIGIFYGGQDFEASLLAEDGSI
ncbi:MAG: type II toxin-antitoxin system RelE/ParE family toxin [Thalassospira sp.]|uniref:type II toxin-antitoxin system RelE/ParE family toxin n=1 Tax=Thalassospira sp. TaxID=1912094 RepID=UPI0032ED1D3D